MAHWLLKTEPNSFSVDDLRREKVTSWDGVRNYQARNFLRAMQAGDQVFIYHSSVAEPAIVGEGKVVGEAYPDPTQFDAKSRYFERRASRTWPIWTSRKVRWVRTYRRELALPVIRGLKTLSEMALVDKRFSRLSIQPVKPLEFRTITKMLSQEK